MNATRFFPNFIPLLALLLGLLPTAIAAQAADGSAILAKIDQYRNFQIDGFSFQYSVSDPADPADPSHRDL